MPDHIPVVREDLWNAWKTRGQESDRRTARTSRLVFLTLAGLYAAAVGGLYVTGLLLR